MMDTSQPLTGALAGVVSFVLILWLMILKPF
jgi:hypothetical protein